MGLNRRLESAALRSFYPSADDTLGQGAYTAAALLGLAEAVATLQGTAPKSAAAADESPREARITS
jgi:hypothetical protein